MSWLLKVKIYVGFARIKKVEGSGDAKVHVHYHLSNPIQSGGSNFRVVAYKSWNVNVKQQYFLPVYMHNSNYDLKFILPVLTYLQKGEVVDGAWVDGSFSYKIIPKSSDKFLVLEFKWKKNEDDET